MHDRKEYANTLLTIHIYYANFFQQINSLRSLHIIYWERPIGQLHTSTTRLDL